MRDEQSPPHSDAGSRKADGQSEATSPYEIPPEGSLGLLALGAVGITEWRYARERARKTAEAAAAPEPDPETDESLRDEDE